MKKLNKSLLLFALVFALASAQAQEVSPVDFMKMNPYQMNSNAAAHLPYTRVAILVFGNVGLGFQNTGLNYDNAFDFDAQGRPTVLNLNKLANGMKESNLMSLSVNENLLTFCSRVGNGMITFGINSRVKGDFTYNDGLFKLLANGNSAFVGDDNPACVNLNLNAMAYDEFALGYQLDVNKQLSLGVRAKLLFGVANVTTDVFEAKLFTDPDSYAIRIQDNIGVRASMPSMVRLENGVLGTKGGLVFGDFFSNVGFGVDLAAEYHFTDRFGMVAAVNDLGFIRWGANNVRMAGGINEVGPMYDNGSFLYNGIDIDELQRVVSDEIYRELFFDSLRQYFQLDITPMEKYTTSLNANLLLRGYYDLDANNRVSAQVQGGFYKSGFRPAMTLAYSSSFFNMIDVCATYTMMKESYANIGLGLALRINSLQIYAATNNIIGVFNPLNTKGFNAQCGIVFNMRVPEFLRGSHLPDYMR